MKLGVLGSILAALAALAIARAPPTDLRIGVKHKPATCDIDSQPGDMLSMHYTGRLWDGTQFDSSIERGVPFRFRLGAGHVIAGWDHGLRGMCIGEKRRLQLPPEFGYGSSGAGGLIPPNTALVFDVELLDITGPRANRIRSTEHSEL